MAEIGDTYEVDDMVFEIVNVEIQEKEDGTKVEIITSKLLN